MGASLTAAILDVRGMEGMVRRSVTHYQTLGIPSDCKHDAIRAAYRSLVIKHHPDKGGDPLIFKAIQEAYEVLGDETKRRAYDAAVKRKPVESLSATASRMVKEYFADC